MSNYNSIEKVISAEILRTNEDNLLANRICNTSYIGDIKNRGDSVTFVGSSSAAKILKVVRGIIPTTNITARKMDSAFFMVFFSS